jgi:hypothetical protein
MVDVGVGYQYGFQLLRVKAEFFYVGHKLVKAHASACVDKHQVAGIEEIDTAVVRVRYIRATDLVDIFADLKGLSRIHLF